jgi:hypothetical protein
MNLRWLRAVPLLLVLVGTGAGCKSATDEKGEAMTEASNNEAEVAIPGAIEWYLKADPKFSADPVPLGLAREHVLAAVRAKTTADRPAGQIAKLYRLARMYDLHEAAPAFARLLGGAEGEDAEPMRTAWAIAAVAQLSATAEGQAQAREYFARWLRHLRVDTDRPAVLIACEGLGPGDAPEQARRWVEDEIAAIDQNLAAQKKAGQPESPELRRSRERLERFVQSDLEKLAARNEIKAQINAIDDKAKQAAQLAELYVGEDQQLRSWAAFELAGFAARNDEEACNAAGTEFMTLADRFGGLTTPSPEVDVGEEPGADEGGDEDDEAVAEEEERLNKIWKTARCLRAAVLCGVELDEARSTWLAEQDDAGYDELALRPNWRYADQPASPLH